MNFPVSEVERFISQETSLISSVSTEVPDTLTLRAFLLRIAPHLVEAADNTEVESEENFN